MSTTDDKAKQAPPAATTDDKPPADPAPVPAPRSRSGIPAAATLGPNDLKMIDALLDEREGYERAGRTERIKAVDKQLEAYGTTYAKAKKAREERAKDPEAAERAENGDPNQKMIDALLEERETYVRREMTDRVTQVDESLRALGTTYAKAAKERATRQARDAAPSTQRSPQQTR